MVSLLDGTSQQRRKRAKIVGMRLGSQTGSTQCTSISPPFSAKLEEWSARQLATLMGKDGASSERWVVAESIAPCRLVLSGASTYAYSLYSAIPYSDDIDGTVLEHLSVGPYGIVCRCRQLDVWAPCITINARTVAWRWYGP